MKLAHHGLDSVEDAIAAVAKGQMVIVIDDDDRENEGDLIAAASRITAEQMAFMIRNTSGIVCAPLTAEEARRLKLDPMVAVNDAPMGTAFTVSVDHKLGADDRHIGRGAVQYGTRAGERKLSGR